tara:strand:+ start:3664 stop:3849 length:186 start_codon:yes stop_codon:yes gene_type:complete
MKHYKDRSISTRLLSNSKETSFKLIIKFGNNFREKIFEGANAYKRAKLFQNNILDFTHLIK